ncbi:MAG: hypothetical protein IBX41_08520 [Methanophagales archaeon]|nr:hypothetical protein [Methanophagales archaeon]
MVFSAGSATKAEEVKLKGVAQRKVVIVTDDRPATGETMQAALSDSRFGRSGNFEGGMDRSGRE